MGSRPLRKSYCGSILSTAALGATAFAMNGDMQLRAVIAPMIIAAVGIFLSLLGIFLVRTKDGATMKELLRSLGLGTNISAILIFFFHFAILYLLGIENWLGVSFSVISGLAAGVIIGQKPNITSSELQTYTEDSRSIKDRCRHCHYKRFGNWYDKHLYPCDNFFPLPSC